jgi:hypothetical protein
MVTQPFARATIEGSPSSTTSPPSTSLFTERADAVAWFGDQAR